MFPTSHSNCESGVKEYPRSQKHVEARIQAAAKKRRKCLSDDSDHMETRLSPLDWSLEAEVRGTSLGWRVQESPDPGEARAAQPANSQSGLILRINGQRVKDRAWYWMRLSVSLPPGQG